MGDRGSQLGGIGMFAVDPEQAPVVALSKQENQVRTGLPAGGNGIRTAGPTLVFIVGRSGQQALPGRFHRRQDVGVIDPNSKGPLLHREK